MGFDLSNRNKEKNEAFGDLRAHSMVKFGNLTYELYDIGPKEIICPIICLPPCTCDAKFFSQLMLELAKSGFRVMSINYPRVYSAKEFCESFLRLLDELQFDSVHLLGCSLGGFLAQKVFEISSLSTCRVKSLLLCNTFTDNAIYGSHASYRLMWLMPAFTLRMMVDPPAIPSDADELIVSASETAKTQLLEMHQPELAARLTLNGCPDSVDTAKLQEADITIIEVGDISDAYKAHFESVHTAYPNAKVAHLETGGHFPFFSRTEEFAAYIKMHFESYLGTKYSPSTNEEDD